MYYRTLNIQKGLNNKFKVSWSWLPYDRIEGWSKPNAMGFYHYPETETDNQAFQKLKATMLQSLQEEIHKLESLCVAIQAVSYKDPKFKERPEGFK